MVEKITLFSFDTPYLCNYTPLCILHFGENRTFTSHLDQPNQERYLLYYAKFIPNLHIIVSKVQPNDKLRLVMGSVTVSELKTKVNLLDVDLNDSPPH